jgi:hypothetical protein
VDWLTFIAALVGHLAWPTAAIVSIYLLRREILPMFSRLLKFKHGDTELVFREELSKASDAIPEDKRTANSQPHEIKSDNKLDEVDKLAAINPTAGILIYFKNVQNKINKIAINENFDTKHLPIRFLIRDLVRHNVLKPEYVEIFERLQKARNIAAHGSDEELDYSDFLEFKVIAQKFLDALEKT